MHGKQQDNWMTQNI